MKKIKIMLAAAGLLFAMQQGLVAITPPTPFHAYQVAGPAKIISALEELRQLYKVPTERYVENLKNRGYNLITAAQIMKGLMDFFLGVQFSSSVGLLDSISHINALILQDFPELADKDVLENPMVFGLINRLNRPIGAIILDK